MLQFLKAAAELLDKHTWRRLLLGLCTAMAIVFVMYAWEHRTTVVPALIGSSAGLIGLGVSAACIAIGLMGTAMLARMDRKGDALEAFLRDEVARLNVRLEDAQTEQREMGARLDEAVDHNNTCQADLKRARFRIERLETAMREAGLLPPPRTDWGPLA